MATFTVASGKRATYRESSATNNTYVINDDTKGATIAGSVNGDIIAIEGFAGDFTASVRGRVVTLTSTVDKDIVVKFQLASANGTASVRFLDGDLTATYSSSTKKTTLGAQTLSSKAAAVNDSALGANDSSSTFDESSGGSGTGTTFTLTTDLDNRTGTAGDDTFSAGFTTAATFNSGDTVDGGAGTDTLSITVGAASTYNLTNVSNVEAVKGNFTAAGTLSLLGSTGVTSVESNASTAAAIFTNIGSTSVGLKETGTSTATTFTFTDAAVEGTADSATLTVSGVSKATNVATTIAGVETLNIVAATDSTLGLLTATSATTINASGAGALTVVDNLATATSFNAASNTGGVDVDFGVGAVTATGGTGNDTFSFEAAGAVSASGGAGNDTFIFDATGTLTTADTLDGGNGVDTITSTDDELQALTIPTTVVLRNFETIRVSNALDGDGLSTANVQAGISTVTLANGLAANATVTMEAGARTVNIAAALGAVLTVTDTGSATTDTLRLDNTASAATDVFDGRNLIINGYETVTIDSGDFADVTDNIDIGTLTINEDNGGTSRVNFVGAEDVDVGAITAAIIDASGLASGKAITMGAAAVSVTSIIGGSGNDTLVGDTSSNINGGAGNDTITGGATNDTIVGGDGDDSITSGAGNDSITSGSGNDILTIAGNLATGDVIDGGSGNDTLVISNASLSTITAYTISAAQALNNAISNIEAVSLTDDLDQGSFDVSRLDSITSIRITDWAGAETLAGIAAGTTIILDDSGDDTAAGDDLTLTLADASGSNDSLTINLESSAADNDFGDVTIDDIERLTIFANEATANSTIRTSTLTLTDSSELTTLEITGTELVDLSSANIRATTINASASTGGINIVGTAANQSITGSSVADTVNAGAGNDTVSGGDGADSLVGGTGIDAITGGNGADTITGSAGNDTITLTEGTASVDSVILDWSENGADIDTIVGFTTTSTGDEIQFDLSALESSIAAGGIAATTDFAVLASGASVGAAASVVQLVTGAVAVAANANVFVLQGATFSSKSDVEDALEAGGSMALSGLHASVAANDAFIVVWTDGTNAYVTAVHMTTETADDGDFEAGDLTTDNLAIITGVSSIGSTTFALNNFEWIA